ncbi:MAG: Serine/threonine-protein kinase PknD [Planctomycetes bacterium]|nr:Serine/threonine-protein kinase PknD [Planctomycetota bacterium]
MADPAPIPPPNPGKKAPAPAPKPAASGAGAAPAPVAAGSENPFLGKKLARCTVGQRIGRGVTSHVFKARYEPLQKDIALKILTLKGAGAEELRQRFVAEAKAIAKLDHENIVKVLDVVEDQGHLCILMEYVPGETLQDRIDDLGSVQPRKALDIAAQVARALSAAHETGIVHRDIKPANIMLARGTDAVKVVDFGLAAKGAANRVGTPLYMSPEAAQGKRIDEKSDVYALGVSLYQMLTGKHPVTGTSVKEILAAQVAAAPPPPSKVKPDLGKRYDDLLNRLLVKSKGYRPEAAEAAEMIEDLLDEDAPAGTQRRRPARRPRKKSGPGAMVAVIGLVAIVGAVIAVMAMNKSRETESGGATRAGTTAQGGGTAAAPVAEDPAVVAKRKYDEAEAYAAANAADHAGQAQRWSAAEKAGPGTEWAAKAAAKRADAEKSAAKAKEDADRQDREKKERERLAAEVKQKHEDFAKLVAAFDFSGAASKVKILGAPEGTPPGQWGRRVSRVMLLGDTFLPKLNDGLKATGFPRNRVDPAAPDGERLVGAEKAGLVTDNGGKRGQMPWTALQPKGVFRIAERVTSAKRAEDCLFLAVLAMELGLEGESKMYRESIANVDTTGTTVDRVKEFFVPE